MHGLPRVRFVFLCSLALAATATVARAQAPEDNGVDGGQEPVPDSATTRGEGPPADGGRGEDESVLSPPKLSTFVRADYPEEAQADGREAEVDLELTIGADGFVQDVSVVRSAGPAFDEAAVAAARRFLFEPAKRGDEPIRSVIRYRYRFEQRASPELEAPRAGRLEGRILTRAQDEPLAGVKVTIERREGREPEGATPQGGEPEPGGAGVSGLGGEPRSVVTGDDGRFVFDDLAPGRYRVSFESEEIDARPQVEEVRPGEITDVTYRFAPPEDAPEGPDEVEETASFEVRAEVDAPPREVVRRTIEKEQLTRIAGTRGDALRTVELLPGVGRPPFGAGQLVVRGAAPEDSQVFLDGIPIPLLWHFGGLTSFINSRLLERIDFYPGNFSARYGRKSGGVLEVETRDPATDGWHGVAQVDVIDASVLVEGPINDELSIALAVRRSYIDAVINAVVPQDTLQITAAPVYWDYQSFLTWRPNNDDRIKLMVYGSSDRFAAVLSEPSDDDPTVRGNIDLNTQFHFAQLSWEHEYDGDVEQEMTVSVGPELLGFRLGEDIRFDLDGVQIYGRSEWRARLSKGVRLIAGLDMFVQPINIQFRGPPPRQSEGANEDPLASSDNVTADVSTIAYRPAAYLESSLKPVDSLQLLLGMRLDWYDEIEKWTFDPRLVGIYSARDDLRFKAGLGIFSQPPEFQESSEDLGNPDLEPFHSVHAGLGFEYDVITDFQVGVEGFYKYLWDRVVETPGGLPPSFINRGRGRIYGLEMSAKMKPSKTIPFYGLLSYTLSRSERRDGPNQQWRLFDFDQTHIFSLSAIYRLPKNWEVGATVRLVSGNPQTPIVGSVYDANDDIFLPLYGRTNSDRAPLFNRLDLRVQKTWVFDAWRFALYLDVQNVYNAANPEGTVYNFDYSESGDLRGLPIIPSIGVRGEL